MDGLDYESSSDEEYTKDTISEASPEVRIIGPKPLAEEPEGDKLSRKREASPEAGEASKKPKKALVCVKGFKPPQLGKSKGKTRGNIVTEQIFRKKT